MVCDYEGLQEQLRKNLLYGKYPVFEREHEAGRWCVSVS